MGKTALCDAVLVDAKREGWRVAWAAAPQASTIPGLWPWQQLLGALDGGDLPQLAGDLGDPGAARVAQFDAIARRIAAAASNGPVLAVIDDAHWADPATLAMVAHFATISRQVRGCLVVTYRPEDAPAASPAGTVLADLRRLGIEVVLEPLEREAVAALAAEVGGGVLDGDLDALIQVTGGNPLFVTEVVRLLGGRRLAELHHLPASPAIAATIGQRMARLSEPCHDMLAFGAAMGAAFDVSTLARAAACDGGSVLARLDEAVIAAVVRERDDGRFEFRHPLFRTAIYNSLGTAGRAAAHARIAEILEAERGAGGSVELAALAHHYGRSAPLGNAGKAARYAVAAGDEAMASLAYETASQRYGQALAALDIDAGAADRVVVLLKRADADAASGNDGAAMAGYEAAAGLAASMGRAVELSRAALGRSGGSGMEIPTDVTARSVLERALASVGNAHPTVRARLLARLSVVAATSLSAAAREQLVTEAAALAATSSDGLAAADTAVARCHLHAGPAGVGQRLEDAALVVDEAVAVRQTRLELLGRRLRVEALFELGRLDDVRAEVTVFEQRAALVRDPNYDHFIPLWRATLAMAAGDDDGYEGERTTLATVVAQLPQHSNGALLAGVQDLFRRIDRTNDADGAAETFHALIGTVHAGLPPQVAITHALVLAARGQADQARSVIAEWAVEMRAMPTDAEWLPAVVQLADVAALAGEHAAARWAYEALEPYPDVWAVEGIGAALRGPVSRALALLATALGDTAAADRHGVRARDLAVAAAALAWVDAVPATASPTVTGTARLWAEGQTWLVDFAGQAARVRDSKGMGDIAVLLTRPGQPVAALDLVAGGLPTVLEGGTGPLLDDTARAAYRRRLAELDAALDNADRAGDADRSANLAGERDLLAAELGRAVGLGGRARQTGGSAERARTTVTTRIKDALRRLEAAHPAAARHLRRSLRTGTFCTYDPDPTVAWDVTPRRS
jgi:hypothetical protein